MLDSRWPVSFLPPVCCQVARMWWHPNVCSLQTLSLHWQALWGFLKTDCEVRPQWALCLGPYDTLFSSPSPGIRSRKLVINAPLIRRLQRVLTCALDWLLLAGIDRHVWIALRSVTFHRERLQFLKVTFFTPIPSSFLLHASSGESLLFLFCILP